MISKSFITQLQKAHINQEKERIKIIKSSNPILHSSKRLIFSLHRQDLKKAEEEIKRLEKDIFYMQKKLGANRLEQEGSYKAAIEEFVESHLFWQWLKNKKIVKIKNLKIKQDTYLAAFSDLAGEIARYCTNQAAKHNFKEVKRASEDVSKLISCLTEFDFTGYLRTKYDQAKSHLKKIEQINYDINIRK